MELRKQISMAKVEASDSDLLKITRTSLEIVRFAVANLPPESTMHWPTAALRVISAYLPYMPDGTIDDEELSITFQSFAKECETYEARGRALGTR